MPGQTLITAARMKKITAELASRDTKLAKVIAAHPLCTIGQNKNPVSHFESLVESVISQQLAVKAADTIYGRVKELVAGRVVPTRIAALSQAQLRKAGVSSAKTKTIQGLAEAALTKKINFNKLHTIESDEEIFSQLTSLWGIGPWTVDMFMMFQLGRLDIWPTGDLGVRRGWEKMHKLKKEITAKELDAYNETFEGFQSVAAWYCWRATEL